MKTILNVPLMFALIATAVPQSAMSTVFFTDDFANGSTTNLLSVPGGTPTASSTSYDLASSKNVNTSTIQPGELSLHLAGTTTSGFWEAQALFTTSPVLLTTPGDNINIAVVFTNSQGTLFPGVHSPIWIGLFSSDSAPSSPNYPLAGGVLESNGISSSSGSAYATGNCELWQGYAAQTYDGAASTITTRPVQNGSGTESANQELLGDEISSSAYNNPKGTTLDTGTSQTYTVATSGAYTEYLSITLDAAGSGNLLISNVLYAGVGTGGTVLMTNNATASGTNILTTAFDGLAIGAFDHEGTGFNPQMDISSITITGISTPPHGPPNITQQPVPVNVVSGGTCAFFVTAQGEDVTYQWHRNGTNLHDGGNISGSTSSTLVISPAGAGDVFSGANSYYVTCTGAGNFSIDSSMASLSLISGSSLTWKGPSGSSWDVATTTPWVGNVVFNYGDSVTFDNTGNGGTVNLAGQFLAPSSMTVDEENGATYSFSGPGSIAGPCTLHYTGPGQLTLDTSNSYTGGTIIQNANAYLYLQVYAGLGNGPVTLAQAGGQMEIVPSGNVGVGINGDIIVQDDFTILFDTSGNTGGVLLGDISGTSGKTLTLEQGNGNSATTRVRAYGENTVDAAQLSLGNQMVFATYETSGSQTYNGVISGAGSVMQKAAGAALTTLNAQNTYSGGTYIPQGTLALGCSSTAGLASGPIGTGPLFLAPDSTTTTTGTGQLSASGTAQTVANPIQYPTGTNNLTLSVGGTLALTLSGAITLYGNDGQTTASITSRNFQVTNTALTTFSGAISDGGHNYGFNLIGAGGVLSLTAPETYTGPTTISNATLQVDGSLNASSAVTVNSNGILAGVGTVGGATTVQQGGSVAPGDAGIGTLNFTSSLTMQAGSSNIIQINGSTAAHDAISASSITYNGVLFATNVSATVPAANTTYQIYTAGSKTGNFTSVTGSPGAGRTWSFNPSTGVLTVVSVNTTPINIGYSVNGNTLTITWPADHIGWQLQQASTLVNPTWTEIAGSTSVDTENINIAATGNMYYRLAYIP
jgi:autotransporter-associated beta strand protein